MATSSNAINATLYDNLKFNFIRDTTPVACIARTPLVLVVNPSFPAKSVPELITYAKASPGKIDPLSGKQIWHVKAAVMHRDELDSGHRHEKFAGEMNGA